MLFKFCLWAMVPYLTLADTLSATTASSLPWWIPDLTLPSSSQEAFMRRSYFYIGGEYVNTTISGPVIQNQMYVEKLEPLVATQKYPLYFITGGFQTATNFLNTPDGRMGWASYFVSQGYIVYLADHVKRGRSPWITGGTILNITSTTLEFVQDYFVAGERAKKWPQAYLHTQWPGTAEVGDPTFDDFYAGQINTAVNDGPFSQTVVDAYSALLDKVGPGVLISHSQGGPYGWGIGDARPKLVKAIVALEPEGPPFENQIQRTGPARPYGITTAPITYSPAVDLTTNPNAFTTVRVNSTDPNLANCLMQASPARQLPNLQKFPILMYTTEASYHAFYDHCTYSYLKQAGVNPDWLQLANIGIHGNAHFSFMEKNNMQIVPLLDMWIRQNVK